MDDDVAHGEGPQAEEDRIHEWFATLADQPTLDGEEPDEGRDGGDKQYEQP